MNSYVGSSDSRFSNGSSISLSRKNRLERFEESLSKLNPPEWMKSRCDGSHLKQG